MPEEAPQIDFFISYNKADLAWAEWLAWRLEEAGYSTTLQAWDFRPGSNFVLEMQRAATEAERTIAVLSPDYLAAKFTQPEWAAAFVQDPTGKNRTLIPVRVSECNPEGLIPQIIYIDLVGLGESGAADKLLNGVKQERAKPGIPPQFPGTTRHADAEKPLFPGALPPIWNVPHHRNPNFTGRQELLDGLRAALTSEGTAALTQPQAIHGLGGVGKTQLATEYAYRYAGEYDLVWWVPSEEPSALAATYAGLARALNLPEQDAAEQAVIIDAVKRWLDHNGNWLLILDNAQNPDAVHRYLPQAATGHVLITSRDPNWSSIARSLPLETFPREQAVEFLLKRTGQSDEEAADRLAEALGDLPLALEQAGAYIEETGTTLADYLELFQVRSGELLSRGQPPGYQATVATTWELSLQQLSKPAADLMSLFSFLAPDDIPRCLLEDGVAHLPEPLAAMVANPIALNDVVAQLRGYSLVQDGDDGWFVHRLIQLVVRGQFTDDNAKSWAHAALQIVNSSFPSDITNHPVAWPTCARLLPHALAATSQGTTLKIAPEIISRLFGQVGSYYSVRSDLTQAESAHSRALAIIEVAYGPTHPSVATHLSNLAVTLLDQGDPAGARDYLLRALEIDESTYGPSHPNVATIVNNLGRALWDLGDLKEAQLQMQRALVITQEAYGPNYPDMSIRLNNMGLLLQDLGDLDGAMDYIQRAVAIAEAAYGSSHPYLANHLNNLGSVMSKQKNLTGARDNFQRALAIDEKTYGPDHPVVATDVNNLGQILRELGDPEGGRKHYQRALAIFTKRLGEVHPKTALVRRNLESLGS